jgi:tetratricopeptide (TPR) repeat protein
MQLYKFYQDNKTLIDNAIAQGIVPLVLASIGFAWWLWRQKHKRKIPSLSYPHTHHDAHPFEVIKPGSKDLLQKILGGENDKPLADHNIPYIQRKQGINTRRELEEALDKNGWLLILGRSGIGKTREAAELAKILNNEGWTILYLGNGWLDAPHTLPKQINTNRKLLFFIDDLHQRIYGGYVEIIPDADDNPALPRHIPFEERLLRTLEQYEKLCGAREIRVIATARNEKVADAENEPSPWQKLQFEKSQDLLKRFEHYELPAPEDDAVIDLFSKLVPETTITTLNVQYSELAKYNDETFRNVVLNLVRLENRQLPLTLNNYLPSQEKSWERCYQDAVRKYPGAVYVYDAVDLLQQFNISLQSYTVKPTAMILTRGSFWQKLQYRWQIHQAMNYLIEGERILKPRDGQIEAKGKRVEAGEYIQPLIKLVFKLAEQRPGKILESLFSFGLILDEMERYKEAIRCYDKAIEIKPDKHEAWYNRGAALDDLGEYREAVASYDKALQIKPDKHEAWYNRGIALRNLGEYKEAVASYDNALQIKPDKHEAWYNRGIALRNLGEYREAVASYDNALQFKPDDHEAWHNRGNALHNLGEYKEAVASYHKALQIQPDDHEAWNNRGNRSQVLFHYSEK